MRSRTPRRGKIGVRLVNSLFSDQGFLSLEKREFTSLTPIFPSNFQFSSNSSSLDINRPHKPGIDRFSGKRLQLLPQVLPPPFGEGLKRGWNVNGRQCETIRQQFLDLGCLQRRRNELSGRRKLQRGRVERLAQRALNDGESRDSPSHHSA